MLSPQAGGSSLLLGPVAPCLARCLARPFAATAALPALPLCFGLLRPRLVLLLSLLFPFSCGCPLSVPWEAPASRCGGAALRAVTAQCGLWLRARCALGGSREDSGSLLIRVPRVLPVPSSVALL